MLLDLFILSLRLTLRMAGGEEPQTEAARLFKVRVDASCLQLCPISCSSVASLAIWWLVLSAAQVPGHVAMPAEEQELLRVRV